LGLFARGYLDFAFAVSCLLRCFVWARSRSSTVRMRVIRFRVGCHTTCTFPIPPRARGCLFPTLVCTLSRIVLRLVGVAYGTTRALDSYSVFFWLPRLFVQTTRQTMRCSSWRLHSLRSVLRSSPYYWNPSGCAAGIPPTLVGVRYSLRLPLPGNGS